VCESFVFCFKYLTNVWLRYVLGVKTTRILITGTSTGLIYTSRSEVCYLLYISNMYTFCGMFTCNTDLVRFKKTNIYNIHVYIITNQMFSLR